METLLKFVDQYLFDDHLYWRLPQLYSGKEYEVQWVKGESPPWRYRAVDGLFWKKVAASEILQALAEDKLDLETFEKELRAAILQQAVFADMVLKKATEMMGAEVIRDAIKDNGEFMDSLVSMINGLCKDIAAEAPGISVPSPAATALPRLRLIGRGAQD